MHRCQDCGLSAMDAELIPVDPNGITAGEVMPSGQCPECRGRCYPLKDPYPQEWLDRLLKASNAVTTAMREFRELMVEVDAPAPCFAMGGLVGRMFTMYQETLAAELKLVMVPDNVEQALMDALAALDQPEEDVLGELPPAGSEQVN